MPPNDTTIVETTKEVIGEVKVPPGHETYHPEGVKYLKLKTDPNYKHKIVWPLVTYMVTLHIGAVYGLYLILTLQLKLLTIPWSE